MYVRPPKIVLCRLFLIDRKNILPIIVDIVGKSSAEQNIRVGDKCEFGFWVPLFEFGPETIARSPSVLKNNGNILINASKHV